VGAPKDFDVFSVDQVLQQQVENASQEIRVKPGIFDSVHTFFSV
jgi:hypothetical protein